MRLLLAAAALLAATAVAPPLLFLRRYRVEGRSMLRAYAPGDRLVVERLSYRLRRPRLGEAVVVRRAGNVRLDLKRVAAGPGMRVTMHGEERTLGPEEWFLLGDNLAESSDSRHLGPVVTAEIVGRVWFRY